MINLSNFRLILTMFIAYLAIIISYFYLIPSGLDYPNYIDIFTNPQNYERIEIGFMLILDLFKLFNFENLLNIWIVLLIFVLFLKLYIVLKINRKNIFIFIVLYSLSYFLLHDNLQLRISISLGFVLLSIYYISLNKTYTSLFFICLAISFHSSSLVYLFIYPTNYMIKQNNTYKLFFYFLFFVVTSYLSVNLILFDFLVYLNPLVEEYLDEADIEKFRYFSVSQFLIYAYIIFGAINFKFATQIGKLFYFMSLLLFSLLLIFAFIPTISLRLSDIIGYCSIFYLITFDLSKIILKQVLLFLTVILLVLHKFLAFMFVNPIFNF